MRRPTTYRFRFSGMLLGLMFATMSIMSCEKELVHTYEVNEVAVEQLGVIKPNVNSDIEVI
ncbi:MAG: hypothetical protein AAF570_17260 [Bacteroidota bacterium]